MLFKGSSRVSIHAVGICAFLLFASCSGGGQISEGPEPIGDFKLGHAVVSAKETVRGPMSHEMDPGDIEANLKSALVERLGRYTGAKFYHVSVAVEAYILNSSKVPVVMSPRSTLILGVSIWDDAAGQKLNADPRMFVIREPVSPATVIGSGLSRSKEKQFEVLAFQAAKAIENWLKSSTSPLPMNGDNKSAGGNPDDAGESADGTISRQR